MDSNAGTIEAMRARVNEIARLVTELHPLNPKLGRPAEQSEIIRALFELTKQVEVIKKQLIKIEKDDSSTLV